MDAKIFWNIIGDYNQKTILLQVVLLIFLSIALTLSYTGKVKWFAKFALGVVNLFITFMFFGIYGTEPIQKFFALPLYFICGVVFLYESIRHKEDVLDKPNRWQFVLLLLYVLYPLVSFLLGNTFPQMVTHIMPCPVISLSIAVYSSYRKKNRLLLVLLTIWGLTGIKSVIFNAYEDLILLVCGLYGVFLIIEENKKNKLKSAKDGDYELY